MDPGGTPLVEAPAELNGPLQPTEVRAHSSRARPTAEEGPFAPCAVTRPALLQTPDRRASWKSQAEQGDSPGSSQEAAMQRDHGRHGDHGHSTNVRSGRAGSRFTRAGHR